MATVRRRTSSFLSLFLACLALSAAGAGAPDDVGDVDFDRDVRPLFAARCHGCHGPKKQESGLRLDSRASAIAGGDRGPAILPGKGAESLLIQVIAGNHEKIPPMPRKGERLSGSQVQAIRLWIDAGARWPEENPAQAASKRSHWAFQTPVRPPVPSVKDRTWPRNPIDAFILARLEKEGLAPSPEADRITLLRRLSLDLVGLPPAIDDVDRFVGGDRFAGDPSAGAFEAAYEEATERLLASPHYGERWGRHWLDAARYADSDGYEKDKLRTVWFYRDWVIEALNRDIPYDRFISEQIAGDLLPGATQDQIVATGFLRNSMINEEGGIDPEQFRMEAMFDRMDAIGKSILGLTIQCAQCHNHKYDPLTQEEYYRLFAFLNNDHEANVAVYTAEEEMRRASIFREIREIEGDLRHRSPDWPERMARWEESARKGHPEWTPEWTIVRPEVDDISNGGQKYLPMADGSFLAQGYAPTKHRILMTVKTDLKRVAAFRLELLNDPNLPLGGPGRSIFGTGALTEFEVEAGPADAPDQVKNVKIAGATADIELPEKPLDAIYDDKSGKKRVTGPVAFAIDGKEETAWGIDAGPARRNEERKAVFVAESPIEHPSGTLIRFYLKQNHGGWNSDDNQNHNLGRFRLSITGADGAVADPLPRRVRAILDIPPRERTPVQAAAVFSRFRTTVPEWKEANDRIERLWSRHPAGSSQFVLLARAEARDTRLLRRGDFLKPERAVQPGAPAFLHPVEGHPAQSHSTEAHPTKDGASGRLAFAGWLADRRSPTTARSIVNRIWQAYFGTGLVATSEDLGTQCEPPSHPELLDWLAVELMDRGWSLKAIHRLITISATYRQSSAVTPRLQSLDPSNRLLARGPRSRVEGEIVRDIALSASGLLDPRIGGRSVFPPLPGFMTQPPVSYGPKVWDEETGADRYRRGIYTFRYRSLPYPLLQTFDAPNGDFSCVRRARSNTPLQALMTLNEPVSMECALALARRTLEEGGSCDAERVAYAFRLCVSRPPAEAEAAELLALLEGQVRRFKAGELKAAELVSGGAAGKGEAKPADQEQLAAWTVVSRVLLNLDETITKE